MKDSVLRSCDIEMQWVRKSFGIVHTESAPVTSKPLYESKFSKFVLTVGRVEIFKKFVPDRTWSGNDKKSSEAMISRVGHATSSKSGPR
jgi:hypothetical protein